MTLIVNVETGSIQETLLLKEVAKLKLTTVNEDLTGADFQDLTTLVQILAQKFERAERKTPNAKQRKVINDAILNLKKIMKSFDELNAK